MTTTVAYQSFPIQAGQDIDLKWTVTDKAGTVVDLTGASLRFVMARSKRSSAVIDSDASPATAAITVTDAVNGLVTVSLTDTDLDALLGDYYYELKVTDSAGNESVSARGIITVEHSITAA